MDISNKENSNMDVSNSSSSLIQGVSWGAKNALRGDVKEVYNKDMSPVLLKCHLGHLDDLACDVGLTWDVVLDLLIRYATMAENRLLTTVATSVKTKNRISSPIG
eukprot:GHVH01015247.1.p1 GENE.GHVH01015247.1~~GHVH01015247.1.p1  ORF type:complete len:105 (+),score=13.32 GHVH01015247.1:103-417(+)